MLLRKEGLKPKKKKISNIFPRQGCFTAFAGGGGKIKVELLAFEMRNHRKYLTYSFYANRKHILNSQSSKTIPNEPQNKSNCINLLSHKSFDAHTGIYEKYDAG